MRQGQAHAGQRRAGQGQSGGGLSAQYRLVARPAGHRRHPGGLRPRLEKLHAHPRLCLQRPEFGRDGLRCWRLHFRWSHGSNYCGPMDLGRYSAAVQQRSQQERPGRSFLVRSRCGHPNPSLRHLGSAVACASARCQDLPACPPLSLWSENAQGLCRFRFCHQPNRNSHVDGWRGRRHQRPGQGLFHCACQCSGGRHCGLLHPRGGNGRLVLRLLLLWRDNSHRHPLFCRPGFLRPFRP
ncbi:hypothetical protein RvY_03547-2 [Ramazzottius varieornatus]|uniref:Uncharacterized protein n=1 Tax=Ramazzottius varieornatus TaxID=947166 RepID=A0A1D1US72_RAMVA|nr:hypothetical protein RvY_03547-2 [Ramazzottius varieornatus]